MLDRPESPRQSTRDSRREIFDDAVAIVGRDFARPLRIDDVARDVSVSARQLQRVFADYGGMGFRAYVTRVRMSRAAWLLANTDIPVKAIAVRVGYRDHSQFSKAYKRVYGVSPSRSRATRRSG
jgi:two-component system response regulator YesN